MVSFDRAPTRLFLASSALVFLVACEDGFDLDVRSSLGSGLDTTTAAVNATANRPRADRRGIISYPNYQIAVARRGDTVRDVALRIGMDPEELADFNALDPDDTLRAGEALSLPRRVSEPSAATGGRGTVLPPSDVDIEAIAGSAIDNASSSRIQTQPLDQPASQPRNAPRGIEPLRHKVRRGETAFSIARLYNVSVRALAEWNGLGSDFTIRENQILLIPPVDPSASAPREVSRPGQGSATPVPPSAKRPLPDSNPDAEIAKPASPDLGASQSASSARMGYPVDGKIIRTYSKGKNNGIDISAPAGTTVRAAADGKVAAITKDADNITIVVLRHADNIMTVYYNVADVSVSKGANVRRGASVARVPRVDNYVHFEVRKGFDSVDPMPYLQ